MTLSHRAYAGTQDLQSMTDLLVEVRPADRFADYPSIVDLNEMLALTQVQENTRLWFDSHGLVGFATVDHYDNLWFECDWQRTCSDTETEIIAWGIECVQRGAHERDEPGTLDTNCRDGDSERIGLLERHGFVRQDKSSLRMVRALDKPIQVPHVPAGFCVRHVAGEHEVEALVALHRAAFGTENMTVQERLAMMRVPEYEAELDLLAIAPDGGFAATCMCSISQEENDRSGRNEGYTDPVATHPRYRRQGLARALLLTGLYELEQRGVDTAVLNTSSRNVAMQRTAQAVGFRVQSTKLWFSKPVSPEVRSRQTRKRMY